MLDFFGRLHPVLVHFPIGILFLSFGFEILSWWKQFRKLRVAIQPAMLIGCISAVVSLFSGLALSREGGYDDDLLILHRNLGIVTAIICFVIYFVRQNITKLVQQKSKRKMIRLVLFFPVIILISITGHVGGSLTHGKGFLTETFKHSGTEEKEVNYSTVVDVDQAVMYTDLIQPILEAKCYSCHSSAKQKGQLRLDEIDFIRKGGKHGKVLTSSPPDSSELYHRLILPIETEKHMPPKEKTQLTSAEIDIIHAWVEDGYSFDRKVGEAQDREKIKSLVATIQSSGQTKKSWIPEKPTTPADPKALSSLTQLGVLTMPAAQESNYLLVNFLNAKNSGDIEIESLVGLRDQIVWLSLEGTQITDKGLESVSKLTNLRVLYLNNTKITDEGIKKLVSLPELTYLNLVSTGVTDQSLVDIGEMKKLRNIYLYKTQITRTAIMNFVSKDPSIKLDTGGYKIPSLPTDTINYERPKK